MFSLSNIPIYYCDGSIIVQYRLCKLERTVVMFNLVLGAVLDVLQNVPHVYDQSRSCTRIF